MATARPILLTARPPVAEISPTMLPVGAGEVDVAGEIVAGLTAAPAVIAPKYFYDPLGSRLFDAITALPEYYPTRTEHALIEKNAVDIGRVVARNVNITLIDLGAGNCAKARNLFGILRPVQYVAVDIAADFLNDALDRLRADYPNMDILGVSADIASVLSFPKAVHRNGRLFMYLGSSIGNFTPAETLSLLTRIRGQCHRGGGVLIGVDLVKPKPILEAAYNDALGVTAAFNLNVLNHLNRLIASDFDVQDWRHCASFNADLSRIEMHLAARRDLVVRWTDGERHFRKEERIHTENSYKYSRQDFSALLTRAGFDDIQCWTDDRQWFALYHAEAA